MDLLFVGVGITYSVCVWGGCCLNEVLHIVELQAQGCGFIICLFV